MAKFFPSPRERADTKELRDKAVSLALDAASRTSGENGLKDIPNREDDAHREEISWNCALITHIHIELIQSMQYFLEFCEAAGCPLDKNLTNLEPVRPTVGAFSLPLEKICQDIRDSMPTDVFDNHWHLIKGNEPSALSGVQNELSQIAEITRFFTRLRTAENMNELHPLLSSIRSFLPLSVRGIGSHGDAVSRILASGAANTSASRP